MATISAGGRLARRRAQGEYRRYAVPRHDAQTVLDVVTWIQRRLDPTLAYRFACRVGMCGSCAMTVNGKARWTCRTHVAKVAKDNQLDDRAARQSACRARPGDRHARVLRQVGARQGSVHADGDAPRRFRAHRAGFAGEDARSTRRSSASAAASATRRATSWRGIRRISVRRRSTARGRWSMTTSATAQRPSGSRRSPATQAAMPVTRRRRAPSAVPKHLSPTASIAGLKRATARAALKGEL